MKTDKRDSQSAGACSLLIGCILFCAINAPCQEFSIIVKEMNDLDKKLTHIIESEAAQRKAADKSIIATIGNKTAGASQTSDSVLNIEIARIKTDIQKNMASTDSLTINLSSLTGKIDSLYNIKPDLRVVDLARQLQQLIMDLKKEIAAPSMQDKSALAAMRIKIDTLAAKIAAHDSSLYTQGKKVTSHDTVIEELKTSMHRQFGTPAIQGQGFIIGVNATMILQGTTNPNAITEKIKSIADASYAAEVTFTKNFDQIRGKAFLRYEAGQGNGVNQELSLFCAANASAYPGQGIWVAEAWYEQKLFSDKFDGTIGYLFPAAYFDNNNAANDQTTQFLNAIFVNNPTIEMPVYTPGIVIKLTPIDKVEISGASYDADADWQKIGDNLLNVGQVTFSPVILGSAGDYHAFCWYNRLPHNFWNDTGATQDNSYGFGLSIDQQITDEFLAFARYGWRNPETFDSQAVEVSGTYATLLTQSWSFGVQIGGKPWRRDDDVVGIGFGQAMPSAKYKEALTLANAGPESHFEIYYRIKFFEHMGVSPDFQYIMSPFGKDLNPFHLGMAGNTANIAVYGIRSMVDF